MSTTANNRHLQLILLSFKGGTKLTRRLLEKRVQDLKPDHHDPNTLWTIDNFLLQHKYSILKSRHGKKISDVLFPSGCEITDLARWDLNIFCFILTKLCDLPIEIHVAVVDLRGMRNELCHTSDPSLEYDKYIEKLMKFKATATQICKCIGDDSFEQEITDFIAKVESQPLTASDIFTTMHTCYTMEQETKDDVTKFSKEATDVLAQLEVVNRKLDKKDTPQLPETDVEILLWNCNKQKEIELSEILVKLIDQKIKESPELPEELSNDHMDELSKAVSQAVELFLSNGWTITSTETNCVLLRIQCSTVGNLVKLFRDCNIGEISNLLKPVENAIRKMLDFRGFSLEAVIWEEEFWRVVSITSHVLCKD